jgi:hypothetical protein
MAGSQKCYGPGAPAFGLLISNLTPKAPTRRVHSGALWLQPDCERVAVRWFTTTYKLLPALEPVNDARYELRAEIGDLLYEGVLLLR